MVQQIVATGQRTPEQRPSAETRPAGDSRPSRENVQSLDRQAQSRDVGAQRAQDFRSGAGGYQGGGGMRGGGGRGGGRR